MKKRSLQIIATLVLSALALYAALHGVNFTDVGTAFQQVQWGWLALTLALILVTLVIRAQRWRILLGRKLSLRDTFGLINIGYLVSGVLPLRAGDPARAVAASTRGPVSIIAALSTVVVERVLDMFLIIIMLVATLPFLPGLRTYLAGGQLAGSLSFQGVIGLCGVLALGLLIVFILVALYPQKVEALVRRLLEMLHVHNPERWLKPVRHALDGLIALRSVREGAVLLLWSAALWIVTPLYFWTALQACRAFLPVDDGFLKAVVVTWASAFGMVFPATGGLGSFHFAVREALFWGFAMTREAGFTYAVIVHALPYLTGIVLGALTLLSWGISFKSLVNNAQRVETTPSPGSADPS
ncbi:MAG TPA: lysylphosphatidylglycerol synthase transmembrane domain-containing protein [Anaerolineae bacterium]|nr:lysylphosphatidylglycerol synthase transmembrane domain-containing protein [Anaerolineae bacterium]HQH39918.1 lysylphosphatidylglycerol synthase transmembrane domain-containing protein [Anaerolineae bacterium]